MYVYVVAVQIVSRALCKVSVFNQIAYFRHGCALRCFRQFVSLPRNARQRAAVVEMPLDAFCRLLGWDSFTQCVYGVVCRSNTSCTATPTTTRLTVRSTVSLVIRTLVDITPVIQPLVTSSAVQVGLHCNRGLGLRVLSINVWHKFLLSVLHFWLTLSAEINLIVCRHCCCIVELQFQLRFNVIQMSENRCLIPRIDLHDKVGSENARRVCVWLNRI